MPDPAPASCTACATIAFPRLAEYLDAILESIATHDMTVTRAGNRYTVTSAFGLASLEPRPGALHLRIETPDRPSLNRMKHALAGPIGFIAARERLEIQWTGESGGLTPLQDLRVLRVARAQTLTPHMRRIVFKGENLAQFDRPDQMHCRLIFAPRDVATPAWPMLDDNGRVTWPDKKMDTRVYTLRAIDLERGTLTIDFALHAGAGPATRWALAAEPGDRIGIVGPAAGGMQPASFYVFAGDETGLPGIARMLEALPADACGHAFIEVRDAREELPLAKPPGMALQWLHRDGAAAGTTTLLPDALRSVAWPGSLDGVFVWGGCEYQAFRAMHRYLKQELGLPRAQQVLYSHWHRALSEEQIIEIGGEAYLAE
jgi:NADPH-dependent ferric siderophore reductase